MEVVLSVKKVYSKYNNALIARWVWEDHSNRYRWRW